MNLFDGRYQKIALIGKGAFAEVWQATDTQTNVMLALKIFTASSGMDEDGISMLTREFALMIDADHRNLLRPLYFGISQDDDRLPYLTLPYCKNGNINKMMGKMSEREAWKLIRDTASALAYLHTMNPPIIHQDIKPANILIGNDGYYKLTDFGVSIQARSTISSMTGADKSYISAGTVPYMAPEKFSSDTRPIMANDVYSLGITVFEMLSGYLPFGNDGGLLQMRGANIPILQGNYSQELKDVLKQCLNGEPWRRPLAERLAEIANKALLGETIQTNIQLNTPKSTNRKWLWIGLGATAVLAAICIGAYSYLSSISPEPVAFTDSVTERIELRDTTSSKTISHIRPEILDKTASSKIERSEKSLKPRNNNISQGAERVIHPEIRSESNESNVTSMEEPGLNDLGYAVWTGSMSNGKPNGFGTMTFKRSYDLGNGRIAQKGDHITDCEFHNGRIYQGCWHKASGETEMILP